MKTEGVSYKQGVVVATSRPVTATSRQKLRAAARKAGARLIQVYDRSWLVGVLLRDGYWRRRLLEITSEPAALVAVPLELRKYGEELTLVGRSEMLRIINTSSGDLVIAGPPGMGKTRLLAEAQRVAFLERAPDARRLGEDLDELIPTLVVVEDAARRVDDLRLLMRMRTEESHRQYRIAATAWLDETDTVLERLDGATTLKLDLLERPEMDQILAQLGITRYWLRAGILDQASGRPGWGVVLARTAVSGKPGSVFDGQALARQVERYLEVGGDPERKRRVLAHVALYDGVAEENLGFLAHRLDMALPDVTRVLHSSTHNGILERHMGRWRVRPDALRIALIERWFLASDAVEPMTALLRMHPEDAPGLVMGCLEAAVRGSQRGAEIARERVPELTEGIVRGEVGAVPILRLYTQLDQTAAQWVMTERLQPLLKKRRLAESARHSLDDLIELIAERYQLVEAVKILLDKALAAEANTNAPEHPVRILGEAAVHLLPEIRPDAGRRTRILLAAVEWLDADPSQRWNVFAQLCKAVLAPFTAGTWDDPGKPMSFVLAQGIEPPTTLAAIANELWPQVEQRLAAAPDAAVVPLGELVMDWLITAEGGGPLQLRATDAQAAAAQAAVTRMLQALEVRSRTSPGLAVRFAKLFGERVPFETSVDPDFLLINQDGTESATRAGHANMLRELALRWKDDRPRTVVERLKGWEDQLDLVRPAMTFEHHLMDLVGRELEEPGPLAREVVRRESLAGTAIFHAALLKQTDGRVPRWFIQAIAKPSMRRYALSAALRPGLPQAIASHALGLLQSADARCVLFGINERESPDYVVSALLRHRVPEVRGLAAVEIGPPSSRRMKLGRRDQQAWLKAIVDCQPEHLEPAFRYALGQALDFLASHDPAIVADWFRRRIKSPTKLKTYMEALPHECLSALMSLPSDEKTRLLVDAPSHWRHLLLSEGFAGTDLSWILSAIDDKKLAVSDVSSLLSAATANDYRLMAPELVRRGLDPAAALGSLEATSWSGEESDFYAQLLSRCQEYAQSNDTELATIGKVGLVKYSRLRDAALQSEHLERI